MPGLFHILTAKNFHLTHQPKLFQQPCDQVPFKAAPPSRPITHQRNTTDKKKKLEAKNTGAEPTPLACIRYTQEGSGWLTRGGRAAMSPGRNIFQPVHPACGFEQDFRHSSGQFLSPLLRSSWTLHQHGQQLLSRHSNEGGYPCRKSSSRLLCLLALELEASRRGTSCLWWEQEGASPAWWAGKRASPLPLAGCPRRLIHQQTCFWFLLITSPRSQQIQL